ncbi:MAG: type II secretion system F family protein [Thermoplasmata archaeon]|nr:type II secretion system F family protein [Thermoplasmata archaeon]
MATAGADAPLRSGIDQAMARPVRVKRGAQPTHSPLSGFQQWAWRTFRDKVTARPPDPVLEENLVKAHMRIRADEYLAQVYGTTIIATAVLAVLGILLAFLLAVPAYDSAASAAMAAGTSTSFGSVVINAPLVFVGIALAVLLPIAGWFMIPPLLRGAPGSRAKSRGRQIDLRISQAMSFVSAMASADVNIDAIFKELATQTIYGEVAGEAAWITRDTELLGVDILTAIKNGAIRTPSKRFQDFLQGVVTTATSGGQLKPYFLTKAEQYERENKLEMLQRVETMGLLAETFVTVVVAFPLFLVIIIAIFAIIGGGGAFMITVLWLIVGGMIPVSQAGFVFFMYTLAQEM